MASQARRRRRSWGITYLDPEALKRTCATTDGISVETGVRSAQVARLLEGYSTDGKLAETASGCHICAHDGGRGGPRPGPRPRPATCRLR